MNTATIQKVPLDKIYLDSENPRLGEFGITINSDEREILEILWDEMAVDELMYSIVSNGFWEYEPLILWKKGDKFIAVEGNRRLAAVKLIHDNYDGDRIKIPNHLKDKITDDLKSKTKNLPAITINERKEAWQFLGFKHVNGPAKWGSFAKAKYIAEIHNNYHVKIDTIAYQIGDTNRTAQKLYQGLMVLEQAKREKVYNYELDKQANRIYFSHLYTGLQREGIKEFLKLSDVEDQSKNPVPEDKLKELGELLTWLYGSKKNDLQPVIRSQNPDLKYLDEILQKPQSIAALRAGETLSYSHELSRPSGAIFEESLLAAKRHLQKTRAHMTTGYKGEENILRVAGSTADLSDDLYNEMLRVNKDMNSRTKKNRITE